MATATIVIMAAGLSSRYGSLKQMDGFGPSGETLMEYSIYDAIRAGFDKVVFVIRPEMEAELRALCGERMANHIEISYAFQSFDQLPGSIVVPVNRKKPFGTVQALLAAKNVVTTPFAIINADDFYGAVTFKMMYHAINALAPGGEACMPAFQLKNTLSANGSVSRGICSTEANILKKIQEVHNVSMASVSSLSSEALVSMNFWGFTPWIFSVAQSYFDQFLQKLDPEDLNAECILPNMIDFLIHNKALSVSVLQTKAKWFGVTHPADKQLARTRLNELVASEMYPERLFSDMKICLRSDVFTCC